ncbi:MAG TPA: MarR family transcriptional regulator [Gaiellales bacterium]|jgi:DNA-binding MarR family transcriptional regulator
MAVAHDATTPDDLARIGEALAGVFRAGHAARLHERVSDDAGVTVDRTGFVLLVKLMQGAARISQLAERIDLDVSTTSRKVAELEAAGLVARTLDPDDRRAAVISATPRADDLVARLREARNREFGRMLADWDAADKARLADLLERLVTDIHRQGGLGGG